MQQNASAAGAQPRTPLGEQELTTLPDPLAGLKGSFRGGKSLGGNENGR